MALPKLNSNPNYKTTIPSTGQKISFRPYLVKEEKVLMIAFETGAQVDALNAIVDTIEVCIKEKVNVRELTTFDIEFLFTQIRAKSVGEKSTIVMKCTSCDHGNEYEVDLSKVKVSESKEGSNLIKLTDDVSIKMKYPAYGEVLSADLDAGEMEVGFAMLVKCIDSIITEEECIDASTVSDSDLSEFLDSMSSSQFQQVSAFLRDMPSLQHNVKFLCDKCGHPNDMLLKGIQDFLQ